MGEQQDLDASTDAAWVGFRGRLADRLAQLEEGEDVFVGVEVGVRNSLLDGARPYLEVQGRGPDTFRVRVAGNDVLDDRFRLDASAEALLLAEGWAAPDADEPHFVQHSETRGADLLAARCVTVLREVHGVLHPAFLRADGLERDPLAAVLLPVPGTSGSADTGGSQEAILVGTHEELQALVDEAVADLADVEHDSDGDIPVRAGMSVVFVRVLEDRPAVELFAEIVVDPGRPERVPVELDILNRTHDFARFHLMSGAVRMSYVLVAWPFAPRQLRVVLHRMLQEVDTLAEQLAQRLEGRRFLQEPEPEDPDLSATDPRAARPVPPHAGMSGLLELLHLGPVSSAAVAQLFEHDRHAIITHLVGIRTGAVDCAHHDPERVLTSLRRALRLVVDREIPERRPRLMPSRARTEQGALISDRDLGEDTLDLDRSG